MFTGATKNFGAWKESRTSTRRTFEILFFQIIFSLGVTAFIVWLNVILCVKIRQEFFSIQSAPISYSKINNISETLLFSEREASIELLAMKSKENSIQIFFDTGERFLMPKDSKNFFNYLEKRKKNILLTSLLLRNFNPMVSRVKIWSNESMHFEDFKLLTKIFSLYGFDDFDFALKRF